MRSSTVPSAAQTFWSSARSWTTSTRVSAADSFLRPPLPRLCAGIVMLNGGALGGLRQCFGFVEQPHLLGVDLLDGRLLRRAAKQLRLQPAVLFFQ
jgi:hypothetical protein